MFASSNYPPDLKAAERFVAEMRHGTLIASTPDGYPQVSILPFVKTGEIIELHCVQADPTFDAVRANPRVTFFVSDFLAWSPHSWVDQHDAGRATLHADSHLVVTRTQEPVGLCFAGEIDCSNARAVAEFLSNGFAGADDIHLDMSGLSFCDVSGIRSLVEASESRKQGRLMLHGLPYLLQRVMTATGWANLPHLVVVS
ncbi:MAG TPA: STAS domain-containing protein [Candidatus Dormibacteraeota bacterium]